MILTNASHWRVYQVIYAKPIDKRLLVEVDITSLDPRKDATVDALYLFTKEGLLKGAMVELKDKQDATSRYTLAALLIHDDAVRACIRRELRRVVDVLVDEDDIVRALQLEVVKRDAMEGPSAEQAMRRVNRSEAKSLVKPTRDGDGPPAGALTADAPAPSVAPAPKAP